MTRCLEARQALDLTQAEFANLLGVHTMTISRYEREVEPTPKHMEIIFHFIVHATPQQRAYLLSRFS